jgi:hypothetical protein
MEFQGGRNAPGWCIIGTRQDDGGGMEPWQLFEGDVIDLIADYEQPAELNVEVIVNEELRAGNDVRAVEYKRERARRRRR